jgi:hypothetical protein
VHPPLAQADAPPPPVPLTFHGWHSAELDRRRQELRQQKRLQGQRQRQRQQQGGAAAGAITPSSFSSSSSTASSHSPSSGGRVGGGRRRLWLPALLPLVAQTDSQSPSVREPQPLPLGGVGGGPKGTARKWKKQGGRGTAIGAEPVAMLAVPKSARGRRKRGGVGGSAGRGGVARSCSVPARPPGSRTHIAALPMSDYRPPGADGSPPADSCAAAAVGGGGSVGSRDPHTLTLSGSPSFSALLSRVARRRPEMASQPLVILVRRGLTAQSQILAA